MKKIKVLVLLIFLSSQIAYASVANAFASSLEQIHRTFSHTQNVDHHHHDAFSIHIGESNGDVTHQHVTDISPSAGLVSQTTTQIAQVAKQQLLISNPLAPPDIFLESPLRPPQSSI